MVMMKQTAAHVHGKGPGGCIQFPTPEFKPFPPRPPIDVTMLRDRFEFSKTDADKDGVISKGEMIGKPGSIKEYFERAKAFERYDTDKDGNVDQKEYLAGKAADRKALDKIKDWVGPFWSK